MPTDLAIPFLDLKPAYAELRGPVDAAMQRVLDRAWYLLGEELGAFEAEFAAYCDAPYAVGVANGLDAMVLALRALGIGAGDEVLVPSNTYIATWLAVTEVGARPVPVEPHPGTWNIDPKRLGPALTAKTRAVMPVHLFGQAADLDPILAFARKQGLKVIEDAAQAHGVRYQGRRIGCHGDAVAWSFYPSKNLGAYGDGGAVSTADAAVADKIKVLRNYGSRQRYHNEVAGKNSRLDELQAAVLRVKLPLLDVWNQRRKDIAALYIEGLKGIVGLELPQLQSGCESVWHLFVVGHERRDALQSTLAAQGIQTQVHYPIPPHLSGAYASQGPWPTLPLAESSARRHLSLPIGPHMSTEDAHRVVQAVRAALE